jgi:GH15 family glucan-1,4-alpha-glucosidase
MSAGDRPIADYALLSDCNSTALVSTSGSIDWACLRRFDAGSVFGRLLDRERGGHVELDLGSVTSCSRRYLPGTMVLETTLTTEEGVVTVTDAFAMRRGGALNPRAELIRCIDGVSGEVPVSIVLRPRFDYGEAVPWVRSHADGLATAVAGDEAIVVAADVDLDIDADDGELRAGWTSRSGERTRLAIVSQPAHLLDPGAVDIGRVDEHLDETVEWWERWDASTRAEGPYADQLRRSALVLKSLCCAPTGGIVAAATTSLPEVVGGQANWDYRYCWIRDASLALEVLNEVGHDEVAQGFRDFVMRSSAGHGDELQLMYGPYGERRLTEIELDLAGWRGSTPVRVGNAASRQLQLDVFGHLLDVAHTWHAHNRSIDDDEWRFLASVIDRAADLVDEPDAGIWELRGEPRHYVYSKVMLWVALDCGLALVEEYGLTSEHADVERWRTVRQQLRDTIDRCGVVDGHFVQHFDTDEVDAALLALPLVGFVPADDPRMVETVRVVQRELTGAEDGFVRRFKPDGRSTDGRAEGVFLLCSFWLVEVLALQGREREARDLFERLLDVGNDVGLYAEEFDPTQGEMLGNFPQAFTHLGLISAARRLRD